MTVGSRHRFARRALAVASLVLAATSPAPSLAAEPQEVAPSPARPVLPWMGVSMADGGDHGVGIEHVVRGSPADKAGLRAGDRIVSIDGRKVNAPTEVSRTVGAHRVGDTLNVAAERNSTASPVSASVVLASRPNGDEILRMDLVGTFAPPWKNVTPIGTAPGSLQQLKGRVVLIDFWATWCGPCKMLAPRLTALKEKFGAQGLTVVGITTDDAEKAALFAERHQMKYPVVVDDAGDTSKAYGIGSLPTMLLVDKRGVVREVFIGFDPSGEAKVEALIKSLLAEQGTPKP